jgi:hypothetical protein
LDHAHACARAEMRLSIDLIDGHVAPCLIVRGRPGVVAGVFTCLR